MQNESTVFGIIVLQLRFNWSSVQWTGIRDIFNAMFFQLEIFAMYKMYIRWWWLRTYPWRRIIFCCKLDSRFRRSSFRVCARIHEFIDCRKFQSKVVHFNGFTSSFLLCQCEVVSAWRFIVIMRWIIFPFVQKWMKLKYYIMDFGSHYLMFQIYFEWIHPCVQYIRCKKENNLWRKG